MQVLIIQFLYRSRCISILPFTVSPDVCTYSSVLTVQSIFCVSSRFPGRSASLQLLQVWPGRTYGGRRSLGCVLLQCSHSGGTGAQQDGLGTRTLGLRGDTGAWPGWGWESGFSVDAPTNGWAVTFTYKYIFFKSYCKKSPPFFF